MVNISYALVLNLHQPEGHLEELLDSHAQEAEALLTALARIPTVLEPYHELARVHLALSGSLLETLLDEEFQERVSDYFDSAAFLRMLHSRQCFEILGTAHHHPVLPLIPPADWEDQLQRWARLARYLFGRMRFQGFWPPEMGFRMELIPYLKRLGYRYVLVDSEHVEPMTEMTVEELRYRPHLAEFGGDDMVVIVRDRELSNAIGEGMDPTGFYETVEERTRYCDVPPLVTICLNGDRDDRFRSTQHATNFWTGFYAPLLERLNQGKVNLRPVFLHEYLDRANVRSKVRVAPGAWNTPHHQGQDVVQWIGSSAQQEALTRLHEISHAFHTARHNAIGLHVENEDFRHHLEEAHKCILSAETSCHFFWDETWVPNCHRRLDEAWKYLDRAWPTSPAQGLSKRA
jgi:alpha-amylase/alpha-mannosidase (GH57 family)